jgi:nucleoside-diphosphate-sugar epimerase
MRVLLTGAAGFIGSSLADALLQQGFDVVGVDAFTPSYATSRKRSNAAALARHPRFRLVEADLREAPIGPLLSGVTHVAHLAALPGVRESWGVAFSDYASHNVLATQRLLEALRDSDVVQVAVASTSSVYGVAVRAPTPEQERPRPISPYGVTKLAVEALLHAYRHAFGLPLVALRYFTVYGPRQRPDMGFHKFLEAAKRDTPVTVYGDGEQTRDFTYVDDAVGATVSSLLRATPEVAYNIGGGHRVTLNEVLATMERVVGKPIARRYEPPQPGDPRDTSADVSLARRDLGYEPRVGLSEGIQRQWEWQRNL